MWYCMRRNKIKASFFFINFVLRSCLALICNNFFKCICISLSESIMSFRLFFACIFILNEASWLVINGCITEEMNHFGHSVFHILLLFSRILFGTGIEYSCCAFLCLICSSCFLTHCLNLLQSSFHICAWKIIKIQHEFHHSRQLFTWIWAQVFVSHYVNRVLMLFSAVL